MHIKSVLEKSELLPITDIILAVVLFFYLFAWVAIPLRLINLIWYWTMNDAISYNIPFVQMVSKLCVGIAQDWIVFELIVRIRYSRKYVHLQKRLPPAAQKCLHYGSRAVFAFTILGFTVFCVLEILSSRLVKKNEGQRFM